MTYQQDLYPPRYSIPPSAPPQQYFIPDKTVMFSEFSRKFGIPNNFQSKLQHIIQNCKIDILVDDSTSMTNGAYDREFMDEYNEQTFPKGHFDSVSGRTIPYVNTTSTRMNELKQMIRCVVGASSILSNQSINLYFMNRQINNDIVLKDEWTLNHIDYMFSDPRGCTPTLETLKRIIANEQITLREKNLLIFIATDGQPTNARGDPGEEVAKLEKYIEKIMIDYPNLYITFLACSSDEKLLKIMDKWGKKFKRVGVVDQYGVEYKEMMMANSNKPDWLFTIGDYITKAMLVSLDPEIKKLFADDSSKGCCTIL